MENVGSGQARRERAAEEVRRERDVVREGGVERGAPGDGDEDRDRGAARGGGGGVWGVALVCLENGTGRWQRGDVLEKEVEGDCDGELVCGLEVGKVAFEYCRRNSHVEPDVPPECEVCARCAGIGRDMKTAECPQREDAKACKTEIHRCVRQRMR